MKLLTSVLLGSVQLFAVGCATDGGGDECLPGDIDCAEDVGDGDGKADAWDYKNDPVRMSQRLTYKLADLPLKGDLKTPTWKDQYPQAASTVPVAWADTYWPTYDGSHNARWQGANVKSPLEKYDAAFNNAAGCETQPAEISGPDAKAQWAAYYNCAGPAAKWQSKEFQGGGKMHDGIDNDGDGVVDGRNAETGDVDGIATWWGTCHAWAPASLTVPEPQQAVTVNGQTFEVADIKALIQNSRDATSAVMLGGRCNSQEISHSVTGSANHECADLNPGAFHVVLTNFLGIAQLPLVEDRTNNWEVWNQGVLGYEVTKQDEVSASAANTCVGATGDTWTYNTGAKKLYEVRTTVKYLTEGDASTRPLGFASYTRTDRYHYILETNSDGKVVGGRFCQDSENNTVDFFWSPTERYNPTNPHVRAAKVNELVAKSIAPRGGGTGGGREFVSAGTASIPDNSPAGAKLDVAVTGLSGSLALAVSVDITHTYIGDLTIELQKDGRTVKVLHDKTGGDRDNVLQTFTLTAAEVGAAPNGTWSLKATDSAAADAGTINKVTLSFN